MSIRILLISFVLSASLTPGFTQDGGGDSTYNDGPYIFYENNLVVARWIADNRVMADTLEPNAPMAWNSPVSPSFDPAYLDINRVFKPDRQSYYSGVKKFVALSDVHGQYGMFFKLLQAQGVIDQNGNWIYGAGHLVIAGDIFDRGDEVTEILWHIHKLELQAEKAKGKVHFLLGNHEVMTLQGDLRYLHKKYRYTSAGFKIPYQIIFGPDTYLGRWLRTKNIAVSINRTTFSHAGFSEPYVKLGLSNESLNRIFREQIIDQPEAAIVADPTLNLLYGEWGPIWYRGYFSEDFTEEKARLILQYTAQKNMVVGHTSFSGVISRYKHKIIGVDSSIKFGKTGEVLVYEKKRFYRGLLNGEKVLLE